MRSCRGCGDTNLSRVLDSGKVPAAQYFPTAMEPVRLEESSNPVVMDPCIRCGLAQVAHADDTITAELLSIGPASTGAEGTAWLRR
jgi:hypothetical protein